MIRALALHRRSFAAASLTAGLLVAPVVSQEPPTAHTGSAVDTAAALLFQSHDLLTLTIEAPLKTIFKDRGQESDESPAMLSYVDEQGSTVSVPVDIKTRGKARLSSSICNFPPLRLDFPRNETEGTLFAGQDKLKLVVHCQDRRSEYEQYVLEEYLIYRSYNLLTTLSFRVRLALITYIDTEQDRDDITKYAFIIEDDDAMAARNGWQAIAAPVVPPDALDPEQLALLEVFQYMIGNKDWSAFSPEPEKPDCCHNVVPVGDPHGPVFSVPYDFDLSGLIFTRYANRLFDQNLKRLDLRSVRQRMYQGLCDSGLFLDGTFELFNEKKEAIYTLYREQDGLDEEELRESLEYLDEFYEVINDPSKVRRDILRKCRNL
jgi:hypothetical protein